VQHCRHTSHTQQQRHHANPVTIHRFKILNCLQTDGAGAPHLLGGAAADAQMLVHAATLGVHVHMSTITPLVRPATGNSAGTRSPLLTAAQPKSTFAARLQLLSSYLHPKTKHLTGAVPVACHNHTTLSKTVTTHPHTAAGLYSSHTRRYLLLMLLLLWFWQHLAGAGAAAMAASNTRQQCNTPKPPGQGHAKSPVTLSAPCI